jgi:TetR/AcrR family transcriptional regulator
MSAPIRSDHSSVADDLDQLLLDAGRVEFETYGVRRTNVDDIAKRAGVSRSTLYRKFPNKDALLTQVFLREVNSFFDALDKAAEGNDPRSAVVESFTLGVRLAQEIPLFARLLQSEPEIILGIGSATRGLHIVTASNRIAETLRRSGAQMNDRDLRAVAEILLRIALSLMLNPHGELDITNTLEVRRYTERYLSHLIR